MSTLSRAILLVLLFVTQAAARELPGPSADLLASPIYSGGIGLLYTCVRNFYVSTTGNNGNPGTLAQPWLTIQNADSLSRQPGDCINVAAGTYTWSGSFTPTHGGNAATPTGYVTYRCQTLNACLVVYNGTQDFPVWILNNPYYIVDGFDIDGGEAAQYGGLASICFASSLSDTVTPGHHLWVLNNKIHGCRLAGVTFNDSEFYFALHNEVYDNAWTSPFEGSGIGYVVLKALGDNLNPYSAYTPTVYDTTFAPFHNMVSWNKVHDNGCTTCVGFVHQFATTGNTHATTTLDGLASTGTSASCTSGQITSPPAQVTLSGCSGAISLGDLLSGTNVPNAPPVFITSAGTGSDGTYTVAGNSFGLAGPEAMTTATLNKSLLVTGPGVQPMTYVTAVAGSSVTLSRPTLTTQTGGTFTFTGLNGGHTDGNGIIMDTWCGTPCGGSGTQPYDYADKRTLVSFNDTQFNGGRGVHVFAAHQNTVINNSTYHNGLDLYSNGFNGELSEQGGHDNHWYNNIGFVVPSILENCNGAAGTCNFPVVAGNGRGVTDLNTLWFNNETFGNPIKLFDNDTSYWVPANNKQDVNPVYVDSTSLTLGDLHLQSTSPAINYANGSAFPFIPKGTSDAGAWQAGGRRVASYASGPLDFTGTLVRDTLIPVPTPLSCAEATAWLARISGYDRLHHDAYSNLICGMVSAGVWCGTKLDIFYVYATYNSTSAILNICSTSFTSVLHGSPAFTKDQGFLGIDASTTVFIDTQFKPSTAGGLFSQNDGHVGLWINNNAFAANGNTGGAMIGACCDFGGLTSVLLFNNGGGGVNYEVNINNFIQNFTAIQNQPTSLGHFLAQRTSSTDVAAYFDAVQKFTYTQTSAQTVNNLYVLAINAGSSGPGGGAPNLVGAVTVGKSLSTMDISNLCHLLNVYMTFVGNGQSNTC